MHFFKLNRAFWGTEKTKIHLRPRLCPGPHGGAYTELPRYRRWIGGGRLSAGRGMRMSEENERDTQSLSTDFVKITSTIFCEILLTKIRNNERINE